LELKRWLELPIAGVFTAQNTNALFSFRGKPTVFGTCEDCNNADEPTQILQFQLETLEWWYIGDMLEARDRHEVVEVPLSFCDAFV